MIENVFEYIREKILVADGAIGTELYARGVPKGHCYDELNLSKPELVERVHLDYINAGAKLIETNTYGSNRHILGTYYDLGEKTFEINEKGARLAKLAAGFNDVLVAGSIGPVTRQFDTTNIPQKSEIEKFFSEQISALVEGGVDLLIFETFADVDELVTAFLTAEKIAKKLPKICSVSFVEGGRTITGSEPQTAAQKLFDVGAKIIGANCGSGPRGVFDAVKMLPISDEIILSAMPNAGLPTFSDGKFYYFAEPNYFRCGGFHNRRMLRHHPGAYRSGSECGAKSASG